MAWQMWLPLPKGEGWGEGEQRVRRLSCVRAFIGRSPEKERHAANELPARAENRFFRKVASRWCVANYKTVHRQADFSAESHACPPPHVGGYHFSEALLAGLRF